MKKNLKNFVEAGYKKKSDVKQIDNYILDESLSTKRDKVYYDPTTGKAVHTIAGTDSLKDWSNNALIPLGLHQYSNRYKNAERIQKEANNKYGKSNVDLVSHSQSGNIAENLANKNLVGGQNTTLNPAIIGSHNKDIKVVKSILDPVSLLTNTNKNDMLIMPKSLNPITEHSTNILEKTKNVFGFGIKKKSYNKTMKYRSEDESEASSSEEEEYELKGGALHEQDIIDRIAKLSHDIHVHHQKHGLKPSILKGFKILGKGIVHSAVVQPTPPKMSGGSVNRNKKFNTWFKDVGQKFLPLNKNLSPIKQQMTQSAVDNIAYQTMTPEQQMQSGVDMFGDVMSNFTGKDTTTTAPAATPAPAVMPQTDTYNQLYQPIIPQPVTESAYHGYYNSMPEYDPYDFNSQPSSYARSYQPTGYGLKGRGATGTMLKNTAANATANLINAGSNRAANEMTTQGTGFRSRVNKGYANQQMTIKGQGATGTMLKKAAAAAVVRLLNSGTERASHEMATRGRKGRGVLGLSKSDMGVPSSKAQGSGMRGCGATGTMLKNTAANATANLINAGSNRAANEMTTQGTGIKRRGRPKGSGRSEVVDELTRRNQGKTREDFANELYAADRKVNGRGATGTMLKNTAANATANLINAGSNRAAGEMTTQGTGIRKGRFKKGSQEARDHMARIRAMKK
jgi:hypothetical protein